MALEKQEGQKAALEIESRHMQKRATTRRTLDAVRFFYHLTRSDKEKSDFLPFDKV